MSIIIGTYNRADALPVTLDALARQDLSAQSFEVIVVDDGSTDATPETLRAVSPPYDLVTYRLPENRGISAARNAAICRARGRYLILLSDDLIVSEDFVSSHVHTLEQFEHSWVIGGFRQLEDLTETPFGRYLDSLESSYEEARRRQPLGPDLWELTWPTARNLSLPRADLDQTGLFDESFRTSSEDQDLAERAIRLGIRFIYNGRIECVHNDQVGDLNRYCRVLEPRTRDTVLFCAKHPERHGNAPIVKVNGPVSRQDGFVLMAKKVAKSLLARRGPTRLLMLAIHRAERIGAPDPLLFRSYQVAIALAMFRGWREGLASSTQNE